MEQSESNNNKVIIGIIVVALIAIAATAVIVLSGNRTDESNTPSASVSPSPSTAAETADSTSSYKDGTYTATGSYQTPGGRESIDVTVTLSGGTITDATVKQNAISGEAEEYQGKFVSGYKSQVVGKKINEVSLTRVAGSSLTPNGFNDAIDDIESQAQA